MKTEENELNELGILKTPYDGKKALIIGNHPHSDTVGICIGAELTYCGYGLKFKNNGNDIEFFVFKPVNIKWL